MKSTSGQKSIVNFIVYYLEHTNNRLSIFYPSLSILEILRLELFEFFH